MPTARAEQAPTTMIDRISSLLEAFDGSRQLTLAQIARRANLPRSSVHRILQHLVELGWVERHGFEYALGLRIFELGSLVVRQDKIHRVSVPSMRDLHQQTGLTVYLNVLQGTDILHIERVGGWPDDGDCWQVGARQPAQHTAAGRALLAHLDQAKRPDLDLSTPPTAYSVRSHTQLERKLQKIRDYGIAVDTQGLASDVASVATAIGPPGQSPAALALTGPTDLVKPNQLTAHVRLAAADIWDGATGIRVGARHRPSRPRPAIEKTQTIDSTAPPRRL